MKTKVALIFVLFVSIPLARSAPIEGAAIQGWYYDAPNHVVSLRIVKTTDVPMTAFVLALTITDSNGPSEGGLIRVESRRFCGALQRNRGSLQTRGT